MAPASKHWLRRRALEPVGLREEVGHLGIGRGQVGVGHLGVVEDGAAGGVHGAGAVGHVLGDPRVVGDEGADVLPEAGPADPDRHAVRRRALLVRAGARGQGEGASGHEHEGGDQEPAPHVAWTMWTSLRPLRSTRYRSCRRSAGPKRAPVVGLPDVVDVGAALLDGAARLLLGLGQAGALEEVDEGEAVEQLGAGRRPSSARPRSRPAASPR